MTTPSSPTQEERCETCRFRSASPYINPDRGSAEFPDIMFACKRRSPVATGGLHCPTMTIWPMVTRNDWCGEWRPNIKEDRMSQNKGASALQTGPSQVEPGTVSPLRASVPSADGNQLVGLWKARANMRHHLMVGLTYRETSKDPKGNGYTFAEVPDWQLRDWVDVVEAAAQAIEARRAATGTGAVHESAVSEGNAP